MNCQPPFKVDCKPMGAQRQESNKTKSEIGASTLRLLQLHSLVAVALTSPQAVRTLKGGNMNQLFV